MSVPSTKEERALIDITNAWNELCPPEHKGFVSQLQAEMELDGEKDKCRIVQAAVSRLYDGLTYGNW